MKRALERYFEFDKLGTNWRTEILAGATTFVTMAYIVFVNPSILKDAGIPPAAATAATCLSAAFGSVLMGAIARYPIALAPGMGLNAYFTYIVVQGMGVKWQVALGAVFLSGIAFLLLTLTGIRQRIVECIPRDLYAAIAAGIGLFIAFVGLKNAGLIVAHPATLVELGKLSAPQAQLALLGLAAMAGLLARRVPGAILLGVLSAAAAALVTGIAAWLPQPSALAALPQTALQLDIAGALALGAVEIVFVFLFVDLFDNIGTLVAVGKRAGLLDRDGRIPRVGRILFADATATVGGSLLGTSTVVSYIESAAGVAAGGRSGVTAIVAGLLFLVALVAAPLAGAIPAGATAPALIVVGALMMKHAAEIEWDRFEIAIPAFLTIALIPLSFSIANGIAFGLIAYVVLQSMRGRAVNWFLYFLTALCILRFVYLGRG
ncbi:MAG: NCS2 family permease [Bryobacteraceae bacterium]|nr:NCS2 family permease [Bryobacteraceae bacterium]